MNRWSLLYDLARDNGGVVTHDLAEVAEVGAQALRRRAGREGWTRIARGAWLLPGAVLDAHSSAVARLDLLGERAALCHWSAAHVHGLADPPARTQLIVPFDRRPESGPAVEVHRSRTLVPSDVVEVGGLRVTTVPRTLRDLAARVTESRLFDLVTDAEQRGLTRLDVLTATMHRLHHGPGSGRFRTVVRQRQQDRSDSALERDTRDAVRTAGFSPSPGPFPIRVADGQLLRLDVAFPPAWFAIECDGVGYHSDRRAFDRDRERWRLAQADGWRLTWVTRSRLRDDLPGLLEEIADAHAAADPSRPPARAAV